MSTIELLQKNNIHFSKTTNIAGNEKPIVLGNGLAIFLQEFNDLDLITEGLEKVDVYLNGGNDPLGDNSINAEVYSAFLDNESATIFFDLDEDSNNPLQVVILQEFKEILILWRDYIRT